MSYKQEFIKMFEDLEKEGRPLDDDEKKRLMMALDKAIEREGFIVEDCGSFNCSEEEECVSFHLFEEEI